MKRFKFDVGVVCGKCVAEVMDKGPYSIDEVDMEFEWSEDGMCLFAWCTRGHDTKVEVHYRLEETHI